MHPWSKRDPATGRIVSWRRQCLLDKEMLTRLYVTERRSTVKIAGMLGYASHQQVRKALMKSGIPLRGMGAPRRLVCRDCKERPPLILKHKLTKNGTGTRCKLCLNAYKAKWNREKKRKDAAYAKILKQRLQDWYEQGPINPKGDEQWIRKSKHLLRAAKRLLKGRAASPSPSAESAPAATSPT